MRPIENKEKTEDDQSYLFQSFIAPWSLEREGPNLTNIEVPFQFNAANVSERSEEINQISQEIIQHNNAAVENWIEETRQLTIQRELRVARAIERAMERERELNERNARLRENEPEIERNQQEFERDPINQRIERILQRELNERRARIRENVQELDPPAEKFNMPLHILKCSALTILIILFPLITIPIIIIRNKIIKDKKYQAECERKIETDLKLLKNLRQNL